MREERKIGREGRGKRGVRRRRGSRPCMESKLKALGEAPGNIE